MATALRDIQDLLVPEFHLRWRERLRQLAHVIIQPTGEE